MNNNYEFTYQSPQQKFVLFFAKAVVLVLLADSLYTLGWQDAAVWYEKARAIAGVFMAFWAYSTLLQVRTEVRELFVPPANFSHAKEFMFAALFIYVCDMLRICYNILGLHGIRIF